MTIDEILIEAEKQREELTALKLKMMLAGLKNANEFTILDEIRNRKGNDNGNV